MAIFPNETKRKLKAGHLTLGFGVHHLRTAGTAMIAAAADHDWLFLDMEHGAFSLQEVTQICLAATPTSVTPLVRVCASALDEGTRALDNGAQGIIVPHVDTVAQARRLVEAFRYPPGGSRSWGGPPAFYRYQAPSPAEAQTAINDEVLIVAMVESPEAVANAAEIAAVEGIDILLIGTSDLTAEMGIAGQFGHHRVLEAYTSVAAACAASGKVLGMGGVYDAENAGQYIRLGVRFVLTGSDHTYTIAGAMARTEVLRSVL